MDRSRQTSERSKEHGVALVVALCAVVLLTTLLFVFFSRAQLDQQIAFSSGSLLKADVFARSAADVITSELRAEIADPTHSTAYYGGGSTTNTNNYPPIYVPTATTYMVPLQWGVASPTGALIMASASNTPIRPNGTITASSISTSAVSANGRYLTAARWFTSTPGSPQLGSQATLPTWLFVTRNNGVTTPTSVADASTKTSNDYVIGRFAYTVYDTSGLLDASVAGYPTGTTYATTYATNAALKGSPAYADLTVFGTGALGNLVSWRNAYTDGDPATFDEWATGVSRTINTPGTTSTPNPTAMAVAKSGHLAIATNAGTTPVVGDRAVLSRQDLLNNTSVYPSPSPTASPALTHFSRSANGPSFIPATVSTTNPMLPDVRWATAGTVTHYNDDGTSQTYTVAAGDPMLQRRFSLAKLAWITSAGPNTAAFSSSVTAKQQAAAILACFGLQWDATPSDGSTNARWEYVPNVANAAVVLYTIKKLSDVAIGTTGSSLLTEPNLFELLKAGITTGSLGLHGGNGANGLPLNTMAMPYQLTLDGTLDLQILRIGANMIDCQGADNYPTTVALNVLGAGVYVPVHGVKDLPYLAGMAVGAVNSVTVNSATPSQGQLNWATLFWVPVLFNPHYSGIPPVPATATPANVRIRVVSGYCESCYLDSGQRTPSGSLPEIGVMQSFAGDPPIVIPTNPATDAFRANPLSPSAGQASSSTMLQTLIPAANPTASPAASITGVAAPVHGFIYYNYPSGLSYSLNLSGDFRSDATQAVVAMEYQDASTPPQWRIYDTIAGNEAFPTTSGIGSASPYTGSSLTTTDYQYGVEGLAPGATTATAGTYVKNTPGDLYWEVKIDPRSTRLGLPRGAGWLNSVSNPAVDTSVFNTSTVGTRRGMGYNPPFATGTGGTTWYPELFAEGGSTGWTTASLATTNNAADLDSIVRPSDGDWPLHANNLYANPTNTQIQTRPVILHRPFRSVGELGYVFRDSPWKSLNFFDSTSGDSALLDIFSVADEPPVSAGRINLNGTQVLSQQALLSGAEQQDLADASPTPSPIVTSNPLASPYPANIAQALNTYGVGASPTSPLTNVAQLPNFMTYLNSTAYPTTAYAFKTQRESVIRALAGNTQTRTWNLLIDVVAQTGRYASNATSLNNFIVDGEKRYWLSIAIDRYTGKIVSRQMEPVNE